MEKEMATNSSVLAWRIPGMAEPDGLLSMGLHRVGQEWSNLAAAAAVGIMWYLSVVLIYVSQYGIMVSLLHFGLKSNTAAAAAKSLQSCPTLCDPIDSSPPGSAIPGILQARTLEWVAISFSTAWKWKVKVKSLSCVGLLATPWTAAYQAPPSMGFSRQEYWSGVPLPSPKHSRF